MKGKKNFCRNKLLIFLGVICILFAIAIIVLFLNDKEISFFAKSLEQFKEIYSSSADNTWDVSANGDGSVWATLSTDGTLTIEGTGDMANHASPLVKIREQVKIVIIEEGVTSIGSWAFYEYRSLTSVVIPTSVTSIGDLAFGECRSLTSINIPSGVTRIYEPAFRECRSLTRIDVDEKNKIYMDYDGVLYTRDKTELIQYPAKRIGNKYTILEGVTIIEDSAFYECSSLTEIEIPNSVTNIERYSFSGCSSLTSINIPIGVTDIGWMAFYECSSLTEIEIPSSVISIESSSFSGCQKLVITCKTGSTAQNYAIENSIEYKLDDNPPTITVKPSSSEVAKNASITISLADVGEAGLSSTTGQYYLSNKSSALSGGEWTKYTSGTAFTIGKEKTGTYYLFIYL